MTVKVFYNTEIHRISRLPDSLQGLLATILSVFKTELPTSWQLQYTDPEGDNITICHEQDYVEFLEVSTQNSTSVPRLYIVPAESQNKREESAVQKASPSKNTRKTTNEDGSKNTKENQAVEAQSIIEKLLRTESRQDDIEEGFYYKKRLNEANRLIKQLTANNLPQNKMSLLMQRFDKVTQGLSSEHIKTLQNKKEGIETRVQRKQAKKEKALNEFISDMIQSEVDKITSHNHLGEIQTDDGSAEDPAQKHVHEDVQCDGCGITPIVGIRFRCSICPAYDLCEVCEIVEDHEHSLLKLVKPTSGVEDSVRQELWQQKKKGRSDAYPLEVLQEMFIASKNENVEKADKIRDTLVSKVTDGVERVLGRRCENSVEESQRELEARFIRVRERVLAQLGIFEEQISWSRLPVKIAAANKKREARTKASLKQEKTRNRKLARDSKAKNGLLMM